MAFAIIILLMILIVFVSVFLVFLDFNFFVGVNYLQEQKRPYSTDGQPSEEEHQAIQPVVCESHQSDYRDQQDSQCHDHAKQRMSFDEGIHTFSFSHQ